MCDLASAALALTVVSGGMQYMGQQAQADAQNASNQQGRELAIQNQKLQIKALQNQEDEAAKVTSKQILDNQRAAREAQATARVSAGESGVSGLSVDALLGDYDRQASENIGAIKSTAEFGQRQRQLEWEGIGITTQSQINTLTPVFEPSAIGAIADIGASGLSTYVNTKAAVKNTRKK